MRMKWIRPLWYSVDENSYREVLDMSIHIGAKEEQVAETVLLPGDPLRAKYIAETFLEGAELYNEVRNMFGYTGTYKGKRISVQGQPTS